MFTLYVQPDYVWLLIEPFSFLGRESKLVRLESLHWPCCIPVVPWLGHAGIHARRTARTIA